MAPGVKPGAFDPRLAIIPAAAAGLAALVYGADAARAGPAPGAPELRPGRRLSRHRRPGAGPPLRLLPQRRLSSRGGFSLDGYDSLMKGGHDGVVIAPGDAKDSSLFQRVNLPATDKRSTCRRATTRPSRATQIAALKAWIDAGAPRGQISQLKRPTPRRTALQKAMPAAEGAEGDDGPADAAGVARPAGGGRRRRYGGDQAWRRRTSSSAACRRPPTWSRSTTTASTRSPTPRSPRWPRSGAQILSLNLRSAGVTDGQLKTIAGFKNLRDLRLQDDPVTDAGLAQLGGLGGLQTLNLASTKISDGSLATLERMTGLNRVFLWNTAVSAPALDRYKAQNAKVAVVSA